MKPVTFSLGESSAAPDDLSSDDDTETSFLNDRAPVLPPSSSSSSTSTNCCSSDEDLFTPSHQAHRPYRIFYHPKPSPLKQKRSSARKIVFQYCRLYLIVAIMIFSLFLFFILVVEQQQAETSLLSGNSSSSIPRKTYGVVLENEDDEQGSNQSASKANYVQTFNIDLDVNSKHRLYWTPDYDDQSVLFEVKYQRRNLASLDWFALGFSADGGVGRSDLCLLWFDKLGKVHLDVSWIVEIYQVCAHSVAFCRTFIPTMLLLLFHHRNQLLETLVNSSVLVATGSWYVLPFAGRSTLASLVIILLM